MILVPVAAFAIAVTVTPLAGELARRLGVLDRPGPFKVQREPVPYFGGLAVFAAVAAVAGPSRPAVMVPLALALVLGLVDDRRGLSPGVRLACEFGVGALVALTVAGSGGVLRLAAVLAVVVLINAVNLLDGLDGMASGVGLASAAGFAALVHGDGRALALALAGALAGFLVHNRPPARIYLGDAGSYLLGAALAVLFVLAWSDGTRPGVPVAAVAMVAVPAGELVVAVLRRWAARRPLFTGDRDHVYDQLVRRGWPTMRTTVVFAAAQAGMGILGVAAAHQNRAAAVAIVGAGALAVLAAVVAGGFLRPADADGPGPQGARQP